ncbi:MAG: AraC family transcriptional regulator [Saprospiraceae bacterium]|nr:AraC family transcriptional regulator [Saprospiraceae bacterium]
MVHKYQHYDVLGKVVLERVIFTPPLRLKERLDSEACLLYSIKGNATLYDAEQKYHLHSSDGILMKCGNYFNHWHVNKDSAQNEAIAIHLYPDLIRYVYKDKLPEFLIAKRPNKPIALQLLNQNQLIKPYVESLLLYFNNPAIVDEEVIVLKVKELLNLLYKINSNNIRDLLHDMFNPHNYDFKHIVNGNIYEDLSIEEFAHLCNLSLSSFKRKFRTVFNDTPGAYIKNKRLEKAAQLLRISKDRIIDICFACGFSNVDSFSKGFKQKYGSTPSEYRKRH